MRGGHLDQLPDLDGLGAPPRMRGGQHDARQQGQDRRSTPAHAGRTWRSWPPRPLVELEPTDHPLAVERRTGITLGRVQEIAETLLHRLPASGS